MDKISISSMVYLGEYKGIKEHERANSIVFCFQFYKNNIEKLQDIKNSSNSAIYFLFNNVDNSLYIGKTTNLLQRMKEHNKIKDFNSVFAFLMKNNDFSQTYIDYIEYYYINQLNSQFFYKIINKDKREKEPSISEHESVRVNEIISSIDDYLYICNIDLKKEVNQQDAYVFSYKNVNLVYKNGVFIILKNSIIHGGEKILQTKKRTDNHNEWYKRRIKKFDVFMDKNKDSLKKKDGSYILVNDIEVDSSSWAACLADGNHSRNGWKLFKNKIGLSLDQVFRK